MTRRQKSPSVLKKLQDPWVLGFELAPPVSGTMIQDRTIRDLLWHFDTTKKRARGRGDEWCHALTRATSPRVTWDDTDLST